MEMSHHSEHNEEVFIAASQIAPRTSNEGNIENPPSKVMGCLSVFLIVFLNSSETLQQIVSKF